MGRKSSVKKTLVTPVISQPKKIKVKENISNPISQTIGQGVAIGAGAAVGSAIADSAINSLSSSQKETNSQCQNYFDAYRNCIYSTDDIILCNQTFEMLNNCMNK